MDTSPTLSLRSLIARGVSLAILTGAVTTEARFAAANDRPPLTLFHDLAEAQARNHHSEKIEWRAKPVLAKQASSNLWRREPLTECKVFPRDRDWPENSKWDALHEETGNALIKTIPAAAPCHFSFAQFNPMRCSQIINSWSDSMFHANDPTSIMSPFYTGSSCIPGFDANAPCKLGGYPEYVVNATSAQQIQTAVNFARTHKIRLVIKNTGHDFAGKSSGAGALSIWTHNLKNITYIPKYNSARYNGPAFKAGSGVQAFELYQAAKAYNVTAVGGEGETVGIMGGYLASGGHSPLSSVYGMGADQALAFELVKPNGELVNVSETTNPDLFWALRGGGGSTFGVVVSVTIKVYPRLPVSVTQFSFRSGGGVSADSFWKAVRTYFDLFISNADNGTYGYFNINSMPDINMSSPSSGPPVAPPSSNATSFTFTMHPFFAPNMTIAQSDALLKPLYDRLNALNIPVAPKSQYFDNFHDGWQWGFPREMVGNGGGVTASRLWPRKNWQNQTLLGQTFDVIKESIEEGNMLIAFNFKNEAPAGVQNAINPAWRTSVLHAISGNFWAPSAGRDEINRIWSKMTNGTIAKWRALSPGSGAYMNEADAREPNFQQSFFGDNYARLLKIKEEVDPQSVFYAPLGVGSESWHVISESGLEALQDGRLCKTTASASVQIPDDE